VAVSSPTRHTSARHTEPVVTQVAIFDVDRTLVPGSSLVDLGRVLAEEGLISRTALARRVASRAVFTRRGLGTHRVECIRRAALAAVEGREEAVLVDAARVAGRAVAARVYPAARCLLERHLHAGDFCVLVSAARQELVEAVTGALGAHRAVGSRAAVVDGRLTGALDGPFCYGTGKLARLAIEVGPVDLSAACAYADSASDLPLLSACGYPAAVNPDRHLTRVARDAGWPILRLA
jgi:HAD superfamily hydrolase (TIGR01490 family)